MQVVDPPRDSNGNPAIDDSKPLLGEPDREGDDEESGDDNQFSTRKIKFKLTFFNKEELGNFGYILQITAMIFFVWFLASFLGPITMHLLDYFLSNIEEIEIEPGNEARKYIYQQSLCLLP